MSGVFFIFLFCLENGGNGACGFSWYVMEIFKFIYSQTMPEKFQRHILWEANYSPKIAISEILTSIQRLFTFDKNAQKKKFDKEVFCSAIFCKVQFTRVQFEEAIEPSFTLHLIWNAKYPYMKPRNKPN